MNLQGVGRDPPLKLFFSRFWSKNNRLSGRGGESPGHSMYPSLDSCIKPLVRRPLIFFVKILDSFNIIVYENSARKYNRRYVLDCYGTHTTAFFMDRNGPQKLPQTGHPKQKSPERRRLPPISGDPKPMIKDTGAAAPSSRRPAGRPRFQVQKEHIRAREGVGRYRIPRKQATPVSVPASKPSHLVTKRRVPQYSPKR